MHDLLDPVGEHVGPGLGFGGEGRKRITRRSRMGRACQFSHRLIHEMQSVFSVRPVNRFLPVVFKKTECKRPHERSMARRECCRNDGRSFPNHGRAGGIRTHGLFVPNEARYQTALQPVSQ